MQCVPIHSDMSNVKPGSIAQKAEQRLNCIGECVCPRSSQEATCWESLLHLCMLPLQNCHYTMLGVSLSTAFELKARIWPDTPTPMIAYNSSGRRGLYCTAGST